MWFIVLIFVLIIVVYAMISKKDNKASKIIKQVTNGDENLKTKNPICDYIVLRQIYNINGELTEQDVEEAKLEYVK